MAALLRLVLCCTSLLFATVDGNLDGTLYVLDKDLYSSSILNALGLPDGEPRSLNQTIPLGTTDFALHPDGTYIYTTEYGIFKTVNGSSAQEILSVSIIPEACGYTAYISTPGTIRSPSTMNAEEIIRCRWRLIAPEDMVVQLEIIGWAVPEVPCGQYDLQIYDDEGILLSSCMSVLDSTLLTSRGREMIVDFEFQNFTAGMGFGASFEAVLPTSGTYLFVVNHVDRYLTLLYADGASESYSLSSNYSSLTTVDFDPQEMKIYVSDGMNTIARMDLDGDNGQDIHPDGAEVLRIDHVNRRIFYTNVACTCVKYVNMDGTGATTIVDSNIREPRGLALVPDSEYVFFTDWRKSKVWRVSYTGSGRMQLLLKDDGLLSPNGLYHYEEEMMIYLADGTRGKVFKFDYDGNSFEELLDSSFFPLSGMITPNAIYVDEDSIYIADSVFGLLQLQRNSTNGTRVSDSFELNVAYDLVSYNLGDNATEMAGRRRRSIADDFEFRESESRVKRSVSRNTIYGVFPSPTSSDIFVQYLDSYREEWFLMSFQEVNGTYSLTYYYSPVIIGINNRRIRIVGNSDSLFLEGRDGVYSFNYSDPNPSFTLRYEIKSNLPLAVNDDNLCFIPEDDRSIIQCYDLHDDEDNLFETAPAPVNFTAVSFFGDALFGSFSRSDTHNLCFGETVEAFNCSNAITLNKTAIWSGKGNPIRILYEEERCESPFQSVVTMFPACVTFRPRGKIFVDRWTSDLSGADTFWRFVNTGPRTDRPMFTAMGTQIIISDTKRNKRQATGVYVFNYYNGDMIIVPMQFGGSTAFPKPSITVYPGDSVTLSVRKRVGKRVRWFRNETVIAEWRNQKTVVINNITKEDGGVYEAYLQNRRTTRQQGFVRLIVAACPKGFTSPPNCLEPAPPCLNGGVLDSSTDQCICAPGFIGCACEDFLSPGYYGPNGELECPDADCEGRLICQPDPYGCSCAAGFMGTFCNEPCPGGKFGADCGTDCNCVDQSQCNRFTGECGRSPCAPGWSGPNCQIPNQD